MFRNLYDSDVTVWSPQGRIYQVEYAMEAVNQGAATVGIKNSDYAVLIALCRFTEDSNALQRKIIRIDEHLGMTIAGLTADARQVAQHLRSECLVYHHSYDTPYPVRRLVNSLGNRLQTNTQRYDRRPYGVGMLIAGYDEQGPHLYQVMPSANVFNCKAMAIGSRAQIARTYLERHLSEYSDGQKDDIIFHGIQAIRGALSREEETASAESSSGLRINVAVVGKDQPFTILGDEETQYYLKAAQQVEVPELNIYGMEEFQDSTENLDGDGEGYVDGDGDVLMGDPDDEEEDQQPRPSESDE